MRTGSHLIHDRRGLAASAPWEIGVADASKAGNEEDMERVIEYRDSTVKSKEKVRNTHTSICPY